MLHLAHPSSPPSLVRPSIAAAAAELCHLIEQVECGLTAGEIDRVGPRVEALIGQLAGIRSLRLADAITKLEICRLSPDWWNTDPLFDAIIVDMQALLAAEHERGAA